jgi:HD-GYP domain-containing protein (c-di-GMP phosphodiesterase class II)
LRFIPRNCIQPEAVLAQPILGLNGEVLLFAGVKMKKKYIDRLEELGISGAVVEDPSSEDLVVIETLSSDLRSYAIKNIFATYSRAADNEKSSRANLMQLMKIAGMIVDEILAQSDAILNMFDLKTYDSYTFYHCVNVTVLSIIMGQSLGLDYEELTKLAYGALLHDIGKVFVDPYIINKRDKLTPEEFERIKRHPQDGYDYIKRNYYVDVPESVARGVLEHHERVDGSGYPNKRKGQEITLYGRILAVADVYDALISDRPYRKGMFPSEVIEFIQGNCGTLFDYEVVKMFSSKIALFPVGTCVVLSNTAVGLVMANYESYAQRPLVKIFRHGQKMVKPYLINLREEAFDVTIISTVEM